ncbi:uracil-DNA glycosylase [Ruminiclostridium hungatei]|uniref:uracil-DNA glycosylase n=1 Tax=Ruminiclostridium hungatei TaxID=48256 RepID=UPI001F61D510|nr:uracil-DNA glycosylase [Ruminiclostridium hungatei]
MDLNMTEKANCLNCKHYYITWERNMPYGCRSFGFKSRRMPSMVVLQSSGKECQAFEKKQKDQRR